MSRLGWIALGAVAVVAGCSYPDFMFADGGGGSGAGTGGSGTSDHATCAEVDGTFGCCEDGHLYYCDVSGGLHGKACTGGLQCGWDDIDFYYDCVPSPGEPEPTGAFSISCGQ
jgi:hypothetical protein